MNPSEPIVNRVAESPLVTIDLEDFYPIEEKISFDLKDYLYMGLVLKEKEFRDALKTIDWLKYRDKYVAICCSADAIVPMWAFMLVAVYLAPVAKQSYFCNESALDEMIFAGTIARLDAETYKDKRIIIKGCSDKPVPSSAYVAITAKLQPVAKSLMYGEACSNVPLYKHKKEPSHDQ